MSALSQYLILVVLLHSAALLLASSGATDSATIRAIESELRRVKSTSETIAADIKKQKDSTAVLQNEFKWLHNELKGFKTLADIEQLVNKKISNDTQFIREKIMELSTFIHKSANKNSTKSANMTATTPSPTKKTFKLF